MRKDTTVPADVHNAMEERKLAEHLPVYQKSCIHLSHTPSDS